MNLNRFPYAPIPTTCLCVIVLAACSKGVQEGAPQPAAQQAAGQPTAGDTAAPPSTAPQHTPMAEEDPTVASFLGLSAPKPEHWEKLEPENSMQAARYGVPNPDHTDHASLVVFFLGAAAGGAVQANIDRWASQVTKPDGSPGEPNVQEFVANDLPVTLVELAGAYQGMDMTAPAPDQIFITAIIDAPIGMVFIRLVGPAQTVEANREAYMAMLNGLKPS